MVASLFAHADGDLRKDPAVVALLSFVSDATTYDAMFYSTRDYCLPHVGKIVTVPAEMAWMAKTDALMASRNRAMERYAQILRQRGLNDLTKDQLRGAILDMFERSKTNNTVLKTVIAAKDKSIACGYTLGVMNSSSFSFQRVAPASHDYWLHNFKP